MGLWGYDVDKENSEGKMHLECDRGTLFINKDERTLLAVYSTDMGGWFIPEVIPKLEKQDLETYGTEEHEKVY